MKYRYSKYTGDPLEDLDIEDLVSKLSDLLLSSGFSNPWDPSDTDEDRTMQALHDAILDALFNGRVLPEETIGGCWATQPTAIRKRPIKLEELIQRIIERIGEDTFRRRPASTPNVSAAAGRAGARPRPATGDVQVTDKTLDLQVRALRDLLGSLGKAATDGTTRRTGDGAETTGAPKYEFGGTLNLDWPPRC